MNSLKKDNLNNIVKPFFDVKFFFIIITIILFGLLILSSASIEISSQKFNEIANDAASPRNIASRSKIFSEQIASYESVK